MDAVLFRTAARAVTGAALLRGAATLAEAVAADDRPAVLNLCRDRLNFTIGLLACLLAGKVSLLTSDRGEATLQRLAARHGGALRLADAPADSTLLVSHAVLDTARLAPNPELPLERPAAVVFTSGSTGEPVGHQKCFGALVQRSEAAAAQFGLTETQPADIIGTVPPQHMYGFETTVLLPLHAPVASWCGPAFYPEDVRAALAHLSHGASARKILVTTPLQLRTLLRAGDFTGIHQVISATAPLEAAQAAAAEATLGGEVHEIFGATEVGSIASRRTTAGAAWHLYPGVTLVEDADGAVVRAPWAEPFPLSDTVEAIDDRRFLLIGQRADVVKLAGRRASLSGLNAVLTALPGVEDGVFVAPADLDRTPTARMLVFAVAPGLRADAILAALRPRIDPAFLPRRVILVDRLPRNDVGKLTRQAVGDLLQTAGAA